MFQFQFRNYFKYIWLRCRNAPSAKLKKWDYSWWLSNLVVVPTDRHPQGRLALAVPHVHHRPVQQQPLHHLHAALRRRDVERRAARRVLRIHIHQLKISIFSMVNLYALVWSIFSTSMVNL